MWIVHDCTLRKLPTSGIENDSAELHSSFRQMPTALASMMLGVMGRRPLSFIAAGKAVHSLMW